MVFTIKYLKQTMSLHYIVLQLFCIYSLCYMFRSLCDHHQAFLRIKSINPGCMLTWFARRPDDGHIRTETCSLTHNKIRCVWRKLFYRFNFVVEIRPRAGQTAVRTLAEARHFLFPKTFRPVLTTLPIQQVPGFYPRGKMGVGGGDWPLTSISCRG